LAAIIAIALAFAVGFALRMRGRQFWVAFCASCLVVPVFMFATVVLKLDGWDWWPVAIIFGSLYGAISGALGVLAAMLVRRASTS
jgi:ABC-type Fe3+ transport system permease subunit